MTATDKEQELQRIGQCAYDSIKEMVDALQCDYDRLEELREERDAWNADTEDDGGLKWDEANPDDADELRDLEQQAGDCESADDARERIDEDPLSVEVRSDWHAPGGESEPDEYCLLLGTGGPAVRIVGKLGQFCEPSSATLQTQDWFTPWTDFRNGDEDVLLAYANCFYYGD